MSTASSASEPPLAQKVKMNGNHTLKRPTTPTPLPVSSVSGAPSTPVVKQQPPDPPASNPVAPPSSGPAAAVPNTSPSRTSVRSSSSLNET